jgi:uncharacterized protein YjlB
MNAMDFKPRMPEEVVHQLILADAPSFPNNPHYPVLIYKNVFSSPEEPEAIQECLKQNGWRHSWVDSIYDFHHYHSNTHETLVIIAGSCLVQIGGGNGSSFIVNRGDVLILPAGVAHKSLNKSSDFSCIGAYPSDVGSDMNYGETSEFSKAVKRIQQVGLPEMDPVYGKNGILFQYWLK